MTHWLTPDGYNVMLRGLMGDAINSHASNTATVRRVTARTI